MLPLLITGFFVGSQRTCAACQAFWLMQLICVVEGLIQLGLLLLVATPVARVVFSVFAFARQHDLTYVVLTMMVLAVLIYSLVGWHP